jgi:hypothetical protein
MALIALMALPATAETASDSAGMADPDWEYFRPHPLFIWFTPGPGIIGKALSMSWDLRFALENGWGASAVFTHGDDFSVYRDRASVRFGVGALLAGFRSVGRAGYVSIAAGPDYGWGERPDRDFEGIIEEMEEDCDGLSCSYHPVYPKVLDGGFGAQVQAQAAATGKYFGIGGQIQVIYIPNHVYAGATLILPIGLIK